MIEHSILSNLINNEQYFRKSIPFLKQDYFQDRSHKLAFKLIDEYVKKYSSQPTTKALVIDLEEEPLNQDEIDNVRTLINGLDAEPIKDNEWLVDQTEKFCQDKAIYNAIMSSINILDGKTDKTKNAIPQILSDALAVSFDTNIGHDFLEDYESRYEFYHKKEQRIPFDLEYFNKITKGGVPNKTLNIALAGCVHPETKIKVRIKSEEREISIGEVKNLLEHGYELEVDSPDGYVPISLFVDKGEWDEYILELNDGRAVRVNENHLFETNEGWRYAKNLCLRNTLSVDDFLLFICDDGLKKGKVIKTGNRIPIVDIQVNHENHRYYTNGVSSHNTGVGKSLFMCHCAAANLTRGNNVLYITLEMAEEKIAERIDANLLNVTVDELAMLPKDAYDKKIERVRGKTNGKLIIKEYPTATAGSANFRHLFNELKIKKGFTPDIVYIDYLNICNSSRMKQGGSVNSYTYIKAIAEELRGLAVEQNVPIISATQTTRSGFTNTDLGLEDTSESFGLPATADFMFALISSEELQDLNQMMVKQLKNRYSDPATNRKFVIGVDRPKMKLYDVEQKAQADIADDKRDDDAPLFDRSKNSKFDKNLFKTFS